MAQPEAKGAMWMIMSSLWAAMMVTTVRHLSAELPSLLIVFFRNLFSLVLILPFVWKYKEALVNTTQMNLYVLRGVVGLIAMSGWFSALAHVPLSTATALSFTSPLFASILAILIFKESLNWHRMAGLGLGFIGALEILRPGFEGFSPWLLVVVLSACGWSVSSLLIKRMSKRDPAEVIVFYMMVMMTIFSLPMGVIYWQTPSWNAIGWLLFLSFVANQFQITLSKAFSAADLTYVLPFDFSRLIFVSAIAYLVFHEVPDTITLIGAVVILSSAIYVLAQEKKLKKRLREQPPIEI